MIKRFNPSQSANNPNMLTERVLIQEAKEEKKKRRLKKGLVVFISGEFCFVTH